MTFKDYLAEIKSATTKKELADISYRAFLQDDHALSGKRTLYDKVIEACIAREGQLGI